MPKRKLGAEIVRHSSVEERLDELERAINLAYSGMPLSYFQYWLLKRREQLKGLIVNPGDNLILPADEVSENKGK